MLYLWLSPFAYRPCVHTSESVPSSTHCGYQSHTHSTPLHSKSKQGQPVQGFPWPLLLGRDAESSHTTIVALCSGLTMPVRLLVFLFCLITRSSSRLYSHTSLSTNPTNQAVISTRILSADAGTVLTSLVTDVRSDGQQQGRSARSR